MVEVHILENRCDSCDREFKSGENWCSYCGTKRRLLEDLCDTCKNDNCDGLFVDSKDRIHCKFVVYNCNKYKKEYSIQEKKEV